MMLDTPLSYYAPGSQKVVHFSDDDEAVVASPYIARKRSQKIILAQKSCDHTSHRAGLHLASETYRIGCARFAGQILSKGALNAVHGYLNMVNYYALRLEEGPQVYSDERAEATVASITRKRAAYSTIAS